MPFDSRGRRIHHIRISITDRCPLRCRYCLPEEGVRLLDHQDILRYEEIVAFMGVAVSLGISSARLTGGEPLLRRGVATLVRDLARLEGLDDLSLTTNGVLLPALARPLRHAGLARINIGLSSLDPSVYRDLTRGGDLSKALDGVEAAVAVGFRPVKVNVVLLRGVNEDPSPFLDLTRRLPVEVRFIEYMPVGPAPSEPYFVPISEYREKLQASGPFEPAERSVGSGPAQDGFRLPGAPGSFSMIPAMSGEICEHCNRLRLTSDGRLRLCLFSGREIDLKPALRPRPDPARLEALLREAIAEKPEGMPEDPSAPGRTMSQIGG